MKWFRSFGLLVSFSFLIVLSACTPSDQGQGVMESGDMPEVMIEGDASYEEYSSDRLEELKGTQKFVMFFHADWCPLCKRLEKLIKSDLSSFGSAVILEVNYDTEVELKKDYGVTAQTTVLFFDENGEVMEKKVNPSVDAIRDFFAE